MHGSRVRCDVYHRGIHGSRLSKCKTRVRHTAAGSPALRNNFRTRRPGMVCMKRCTVNTASRVRYVLMQSLFRRRLYLLDNLYKHMLLYKMLIRLFVVYCLNSFIKSFLTQFYTDKTIYIYTYTIEKN